MTLEVGEITSHSPFRLAFTRCQPTSVCLSPWPHSSALPGSIIARLADAGVKAFSLGRIGLESFVVPNFIHLIRPNPLSSQGLGRHGYFVLYLACDHITTGIVHSVSSPLIPYQRKEMNGIAYGTFLTGKKKKSAGGNQAWLIMVGGFKILLLS